MQDNCDYPYFTDDEIGVGEVKHFPQVTDFHTSLTDTKALLTSFLTKHAALKY